jgi:hypothetical protein
MRTLIALLICVASSTSTAQSMCECGTDYKMYRSEANGVNSFYIDASDLIKILTAYGQQSPFIYDFDPGLVDIGDLLTYMGGFGNTPPELNYCDIVVDFVASSGWPATYPNAYFAVVKPTVFDETGGTFEDCPLRSWWVEIVDDNGSTRYWFH